MVRNKANDLGGGDINKVVKALDELKKEQSSFLSGVNEVLVETKDYIDLLTNINNELKNAILQQTSEIKKVSSKALAKSTQLMEGGYWKMYGGVGSGLSMKGIDIEAIRSTWFGRGMLQMLGMYKRIYIMFPALGYAGVRIFSRMVRSFEAYAKAHANKQQMVLDNALKRESILYKIHTKMIDIVRKLRRGVSQTPIGLLVTVIKDKLTLPMSKLRAAFIGGVTKLGRGWTSKIQGMTPEEMKEVLTTIQPYKPTEEMGQQTGGIAGGIGKMTGAISGMFLSIQAIFAIVKVIGFIFGDAVKGVMSVVKIFKAAVTLLLKPIFDIMMIALMPVAIFFLILFSNLYKWLMKSGLKNGFKAMMTASKKAVEIAEGIGGVVDFIQDGMGAINSAFSDFGEGLQRIGEDIGNAFNGAQKWFDDNVTKPLADFFAPIIDFVRETIGVWTDIGGIIWDAFSGNWTDMGEKLISVKDKIIDLSSKFVSFIVDGIKGVGSWYYDTILSPILSFFDPIIRPIKDFIDDIWDGIKAVFRIWQAIFSGDWDFVKDVFSEVLDDFKGEIYDKFKPIIEPIKNVLDSIWGAIQSVVGGVSNIAGGVVDGIRNVFGFQTGGYVMQTGLYKLHAGEYVLPRWNAERRSESNNTYNITINIEGNTNEDVAEEIIRRLKFELGIGGV